MIRLGVVGYGGRISYVIQDCLRGVDPDCQVVGVVDPNVEGTKERIKNAEQPEPVFYKSLKEMMSKANLDGLLIGTRCNLHTKYAIEAAAYDIPLYLEKPVSVDMKQARALEKAFRKSKCPVVVSFPLRVSPLCEATRKSIADGFIGKPNHIAAMNYVPYGRTYWENFYKEYDISGGLFLQKATHDLDYMMYLMGAPIVRVAAMGSYHQIFGGSKQKGLTCSKCKETKTCLESPENRARNNLGKATDDHACLFSKDCGNTKTGTNEDASSCLVEFANGAHGLYTQVFYIRGEAKQRGAKISGYMGTLDFDWYRNDLKRIEHHGHFTEEVKPSAGLSHFGGDAELAWDYLDLIKGNKKVSRTPIETGLESVYACLAARESALTGKFVNVQQVNM